MATQAFTHLHVHSEYSLLDGSAKINELISRTKELGMDSLAITDHGVMFGVVDFYKAALAQGIKPILGCEVYVASGSRTNKSNEPSNFYYHLVLLAENNEGYQNLIKLVSLAYTEGFYYKPRIDKDILAQYSKGLIALSACLAGPIARNFLRVSYNKAKEEAIFYEQLFGAGNFFLEIQDHGLAEQKRVNDAIIQIAKETGIPLVATNDVHYIDQSDALAHEVLLCIQTGKTMQDTDRMVYEGEQFYLKSPQQMQAIFAHVTEALQNTQTIAKRCQVNFVFNDYKLPKFQLQKGENAFLFLRERCMEGLQKRYGEVTEALINRLDYELSVISSMGFVDYFLITWDFIRFALNNNIPVGPGRGSAAGCLVAYSLGITSVDPIAFSLLFERFLNPERVSMPDIDIDFCYERRQEVIDYVVEKYGKDHVAQIITFGTMAARGAIRDVGRALGIPYNEVDKVAKMIPFAIGMTIAHALDVNAQLRTIYEQEEPIKGLIDMAKKLEGLPRHASTHAAGVVICNEPVDCHVPLYQNDGVVTTQFPMTTLEELGLLKMDFLGLRTLTVIQKTVDEVARNHGVTIDMAKLNLHDPKVFELISNAKTEGVFQLESSGMKSFMKELRPTSLEDLTAGISLYRPGPMDFIPKYIRGKNNKNDIRYTHQSLEPILSQTYGCIVYQEQVMQIVRDLAGYSLGRSDLMRRAMSKKKADVMEQERKNFVFGLGDEVPGCIKKGIPQQTAEAIFDEMADFAKYAFNKSHAAAYALIGYQTAWLKVYYKTEFMAALMSSVMDSASKIAEYIAECKKMGISVLPPDLNEGYGDFSVHNNTIRFGLNAIKNLGRPTVVSIVSEREENGPFKSLTDFINRLSSKDLNKRGMESLIKAGALDSLGGFRSQYAAIYEKIMSGLSETKKRNLQGQLSLFDMVEMSGVVKTSQQDDLPQIPEFPMETLLADEKEILGIYVSGHPFAEFEEELKAYATVTSLDFGEKSNLETQELEVLLEDNQEVAVGGIVTAKSVKYTKNNNAMAFLTLEDLYGSMEVIVFPNIYEKISNQLELKVPLLVWGRITIREDEAPKVIANKLKVLQKSDTGMAPSKMKLWLKISKNLQIPYDGLMDVLSRYRGNTPVVIYDEKTGARNKTTQMFWVNHSNEVLLLELKQMLGETSVVLKED